MNRLEKRNYYLNKNNTNNNNNFLHQDQLQHKAMVKTNVNNYQAPPTHVMSSSSANENSQYKTPYEQKCTCCPYGYHIDLDFLRYLEAVRIETHSKTLPRKTKPPGGRPPYHGISLHDRSVFSEDESVSTGRARAIEAEGRRPDSACANLSMLSQPYVINPTAEPDVLVAIPDESRTMRSEVFLDPETEKIFRASTELFIINQPQPKHEHIGLVANGRNKETFVADIKFRKIIGTVKPPVDELNVAKRFRSSVAIIIEQLENCLGTPPSKVDTSLRVRTMEKEDDAIQMTRIQILCSNIIAKLRRLHELEEQVRTIPDRDDHVLSLTRQLDHLKMKQQQQKLFETDPSSKARSRVATRDVGVGNAVVFARSNSGGATSPTLKKFADISAPPLPPPPPQPSTSKRVRDVSVQVSTPATPVQNERRMSEKKIYLDYEPGSSKTESKVSPFNINSENDSSKFCCIKCGSTDVTKMKVDGNGAAVDRGVSKIINSFNIQSRNTSDESIGTKKDATNFQTVFQAKLNEGSSAEGIELKKMKKIPPTVAPKPKVSQKTLSDHETINIKNVDLHVTPVDLYVTSVDLHVTPVDLHVTPVDLHETPVEEEVLVSVESEKSTRAMNMLSELLRRLGEAENTPVVNKEQFAATSAAATVITDATSIVDAKDKEPANDKEIMSAIEQFETAELAPVPSVRISTLLSKNIETKTPVSECVTNIQLLQQHEIEVDPVNLFIDNHQRYIHKPLITTMAKEKVSAVPAYKLESTGKSARPIVVDLLESSSESEDSESPTAANEKEGKELSGKIGSEVKIDSSFVEQKQEDKGLGFMIRPTSSECLVSEITIEYNNDNAITENINLECKQVASTICNLTTAIMASDLSKRREGGRTTANENLPDKEVFSEADYHWMESISNKILSEAKQEVVVKISDCATNDVDNKILLQMQHQQQQQQQGINTVVEKLESRSSTEVYHPTHKKEISNLDPDKVSPTGSSTHAYHQDSGGGQGLEKTVEVSRGDVLSQDKWPLATRVQLSSSSSSSSSTSSSQVKDTTTEVAASSSSSSLSPPPQKPPTTRTPHPNVANLDAVEPIEHPINVMESVDSKAPNSSDISSEVKKNLFAETLTSDVALTTTSDSSEAETWAESTPLADVTTNKEQNLFVNSHKLFLRAASGRTGALSDPGDLWKKKSISSEFAVPSSADDDDYSSSSCDAGTAESECEASKGCANESSHEFFFSGEVCMPNVRDDQFHLGEKVVEGESVTVGKSFQSPPMAAASISKSSILSSVTAESSATPPKSAVSDTSVSSSKTKTAQERIKSSSSGSLNAEGDEFGALGSQSSAITSQSLDADINEELATIRNPCVMSVLRSPPPLITVTPSAVKVTSAVLGLSSDLSACDDEEINNNMFTSGGNDGDEEGEEDEEDVKRKGKVSDDDDAAEIGAAASGGSIGDQGGVRAFQIDEEKLTEDDEDCFLEACVIYANWLADSTSITESEKDAILELIRKDWFLTSGRKMSQGSDVRNALTTTQTFGDVFVDSVINLADADGNTTLHYAVSHGNGPVIEVLLETGLCEVDRQNHAGYTPIMLAALLIDDVPRNYDLLKALFEAGDINAASDRSGQTALMLASSHGRDEMVSLLLECCADINIQDEDGSTALMCASEHGHVEIIKILLAHSLCNSSLSDIDGSTALSIAMEEGNHDVGILIYAHMKAHGAIDDEEEDIGADKISEV